ncbi:hypothetical protein KDA_75630 [Dictyobacter alpinus]|uniref:Uncharacterized protein n=1 Tax=Dictyobacter alpinus TaxID=2014873 RepID=A0A402BL77_9CHLR|nr:hypothetical protein [Dictyobacter alpinus]GCE32079.1 hypothetical protein KDA_75630 [Dictyobacter alpinus]
MDSDIAKALVKPMPLDLPFPTPSILAWEIGIVVVCVIIIVFRRFLIRTEAGRWLLSFLRINLHFAGIFLLLTLLSLTPMASLMLSTLNIGATLRDLGVGLVWGIGFDVLMILWLRVLIGLAIRND